MIESLEIIGVEIIGGPADGQHIAIDISSQYIWFFTAEITDKEIISITHEYKIDHKRKIANYYYK